MKKERLKAKFLSHPVRSIGVVDFQGVHGLREDLNRFENVLEDELPELGPVLVRVAGAVDDTHLLDERALAGFSRSYATTELRKSAVPASHTHKRTRSAPFFCLIARPYLAPEVSDTLLQVFAHLVGVACTLCWNPSSTVQFPSRFPCSDAWPCASPRPGSTRMPPW